MTALNDTFTEREVARYWHHSVIEWELDQARDDDSQKLRAETMLTPVPATVHERSLRRQALYDQDADNWDNYGYDYRPERDE